MRGVYLVAAELTRLGFIVSPTSRSALGADLLVTDQRCKRAYSVQVKTNATSFGFWLIGKHARETVSDTHIYVLVNIRSNKKRGEWTEFRTKAEMVKAIGERCRREFPTTRFNFTQPIIDSVTEDTNGTSANLAVEFSGPDSEVILQLCRQTVDILR